MARILLLKKWLHLIKGHCRDTIFRGTIDEPIRIHEIDKTIWTCIIESNYTEFLKKETRGFIPDFFYWFDRRKKGYHSRLTAWYRCITRIFCNTNGSGDTSLFGSTIKTGNTANLGIWNSTNFYSVIWSKNLKSCINRPNLVWSNYCPSSKRRRVCVLRNPNLWCCTGRKEEERSKQEIW